MIKHDFTFIDLFAGIGTIRLAFEAIGGRCVSASEWEKMTQRTYETHFGHRPTAIFPKFRQTKSQIKMF